MAITPTRRLLCDRDAARPNLISQTLLSGDVKDEDCPWVEVGNLYLSVTIIGENSWLPLVSLLNSRPDSLRYDKTKYVVFTGRHGDIPNLVDETGKTVKVFAPDHFEEDKNVQAKALSNFPGIEIELVDAGRTQKGHSEWLKKETSKHIFAHKTVIYAWCYGLFTMCETSSSLPEKVANSHQAKLIEQTVGTLVQSYWNWVPRSIM